MDKVFFLHLSLIFIFAVVFVVMYLYFSVPSAYMIVVASILFMLMLMTDSVLRKEKPSW
ncbi:MAG: hypothetical protein ACP5LN_10165 [Thermoproteota archaeon]|jgi:hypothetical protein